MERYVKAVLAIVPIYQRRNVKLELQNKIKSEEDWKSMGTPDQYVQNLRKGSSLVDLHYFSRYECILQLILGIMIGSLMVGYSIHFYLYPMNSFSEAIIYMVPRGINALGEGFLWVTLSFIAFQYLRLPFVYLESTSFSEALLMELPDQRYYRRHIWTILKLVLFTFLITLLLFTPEIMVFEPFIGSTIFNMSNIENLQYYFTLVYVLILFKSIIRIYQTRIDYRSAMLYSICNLLTLLFIIGMMNYPQMFNPDFIVLLEVDFPRLFHISNIIVDSSLFISWYFILLYLIDTANVLYKGLKNDKENL